MPLSPLALVIGYFFFLNLSLKTTLISAAFCAGLWGVMRGIILSNREESPVPNPIALFLMLVGSIGTVVGVIATVVQLVR